ncbi:MULTISPECIES: amidase [Variovorax]|jgi:aspartyl-tRNA(Asn)/glutamyl-tRNA(Gln) amidotransferase subunit A|uniref:amidase n=1 Tax=Variovorax TaxID=34072 RepID=UPI00086884BE|nr:MULTISPECIES: amidase family protein [Variovorax]MBN8755895.1 amidase [Variovorax sp.]ODU15109.1 MAG: amidase [Variovorax sp. SCN 67-85]ODV24043.1 MAG: amidase [Variovorax sp. SCN 67-20]OJZ09967.1 MAG: amidase [Variovorax sp. 67-131]UKI06576.1 amidase [Variovorax paradoxus]
MDLMDHSATELAALIRDRKASPVEAVQAALSRIEARRELNAFITVTGEQALDAARRAEAAVMAGEALGPLHGVPYSVKDLTLTAGVRTTMGSAIYEDFVPEEDAVAVARAKAAGAILIGKTTTPEFGHKQVATAPIFGRTLNPIDARYTPGASSSGAAVAVAAGLGSLALGTDGGGSIRIPASCCGIVGLKATLGVVPNLQAPDLYSANSFTGPMARDVADTQLLFDAIKGFDARDPYGLCGPMPRRARPASLRGLRVAWLPTAGNPVDPEVEAVTTAAVKAMEREGAVVETVMLDFVSLERHFLVVLQSMLAARVGANLERFGDRLDATLIDAVRKGRQHSAVDLHEATFAKTRCFTELQALFGRFDVLVSPTVSAPPLPIDMDVSGEVEIGGKPAGTIRGAWYPYTYPMNLTGHPALSMPCGKSTNGLPIGLQLAGRWYDDDYLLAIAGLVEQALG